MPLNINHIRLNIKCITRSDPSTFVEKEKTLQGNLQGFFVGCECE